ncbi:hypothetical protein SNOD_07510 [Streptomyces nodosus]|uniref:DNA-binding response regulator n=1 Tax=Streptomyces nodosus TaxID=40318 RepID=A0A0B5DIT0_9ACTN|nr:hypothetical protein SNOD_07510 [Streptomyces nodosus]
MAIRVLLVDDQPLLRTGFRMILEAEQDIAVVGEAGDGLQSLDQVRALQPDVVLMDIRMPRMDGVEATRQITGPGRDGPAKVLVLTTFDLDEYVVEALRAGASGFLLKDAPAHELVQAIRVVAAGEAMLAPSITRRLLDKYAGHLPSGEEPVPDTLGTLTEREVEVLKLVARGLSNAEIAADLFVSETTVKTHVGHVLTKLGLRDRVQAAVYAYESGLVRPVVVVGSARSRPVHRFGGRRVLRCQVLGAVPGQAEVPGILRCPGTFSPGVGQPLMPRPSSHSCRVDEEFIAYSPPVMSSRVARYCLPCQIGRSGTSSATMSWMSLMFFDAVSRSASRRDCGMRLLMMSGLE